MTNNRADYEAKFQMLVEDYLSNVEEANRNGRLLPARTVIDQLGRCRRHNFSRRDRALLGQVQLARNSRSTQWLDIAARDARAISMWDHAWIRRHIHSRNLLPPVRRPSPVRSRRDVRRSGRSRRDGPLGRALPPRVEHRPSAAPAAPGTVDLPRVDDRQRSPSRHGSPMIQSPTMSEEEALLREEPEETITLVEPSSPKETSSAGRPRQRRRHHHRSGHSGQVKKPRYEMLVVQRDRGMTVEVPRLSMPAASSGRAQCPVAECPGDDSRQHAFECHLPPVFREEIHGPEVTARRIGALSMLATWLMGQRSSLRSLANYFHLLDLSTSLERVTPLQERAMTGVCVRLGLEIPDRFDVSSAGNEEWQLVHWQVLLRLLARVEPPARMQSLRDLFPLNPDEEALLPRPPLAFDSHCHLDRCRTDFRLPRTASLQEICAQARPKEDYVVQLEGVTASFCDPETYPTPEEVKALTDQGCYVVIGVHPKKWPTEEDWAKFKELVELPEVSGVGEIGIDHSVAIEDWTAQADKVDRALDEVMQPKLLVLHCRGMPNKDNTEAYDVLLRTLRYNLGTSTLMHLHCFNGSSAVVDKWLKLFKNTYFGFTKMVENFNEEQIAAVRGLHEGRLLVETDAPYFRYGDDRHSTPAVIGMTAAKLAKVRGCSDWRALLNITRENAKRLYGQHLPPALD